LTGRDAWQQDGVIVVQRPLRYPKAWPAEKAQDKGADVVLAVDFVASGAAVAHLPGSAVVSLSPGGRLSWHGGPERLHDSVSDPTEASVAEAERLDVRKTYKLYIGGKFPRTESGRSYLVSEAKGKPWANACRASRKDVRDAVQAARKAFPGWAGATAYNRGQILYRVAEMLEGRRDQFVDEVARAEGMTRRTAGDAVAKTVDRWVWYAGWADKLAQVLGSANPVAGPYFNFSVPEPTGVVGLVAPAGSSLLGLVSRLAPAIVSGNTAVVVASETRPLPAITLAEVLATSDLPGGVVNVLTGFTAELIAPLAAHMDVNALDLAGLDLALYREAELAAAENVKRVVPPVKLSARDWLSDAKGQDPYWIASFLEIKTVWHPVGV